MLTIHRQFRDRKRTSNTYHVVNRFFDPTVGERGIVYFIMSYLFRS